MTSSPSSASLRIPEVRRSPLSHSTNPPPYRFQPGSTFWLRAYKRTTDRYPIMDKSKSSSSSSGSQNRQRSSAMDRWLSESSSAHTTQTSGASTTFMGAASILNLHRGNQQAQSSWSKPGDTACMGDTKGDPKPRSVSSLLALQPRLARNPF